MANEVYVNIKDNHFKVWGYDCFVSTTGQESSVTTYWGKIGVTMDKLQKKEKTFPTNWAARDFVWSKINEKINKGYNSIPNWQYFGAINEGKPVSQLVRLIEVYQKAQRR